MADEFTCARCKQTFEKGWSDEEAAAEARAVFGEIPEEERATVCDDCYQLMMQPSPLIERMLEALLDGSR